MDRYQVMGNNPDGWFYVKDTVEGHLFLAPAGHPWRTRNDARAAYMAIEWGRGRLAEVKDQTRRRAEKKSRDSWR